LMLSNPTARSHPKRGHRLKRRALYFPALSAGASLACVVPEGIAQDALPQARHDLHVVWGRARQLRAAPRRGDVSEGARLHADRLDPPRALSRHRLFGLRARPGRPLHSALLLHGADRLGRPSAPGIRAPQGQWRGLARGIAAALGHLRRPGLPRPARLAHQVRAPAKAGAYLSVALTLNWWVPAFAGMRFSEKDADVLGRQHVLVERHFAARDFQGAIDAAQ